MSSGFPCTDHVQPGAQPRAQARARADRADPADRHTPRRLALLAGPRTVVGCLPGLLGMLLVVGGCTIGAQAEPDLVVLPSSVAPATTGSPTGVPLSLQVYLVRGDRLQRVTRSVASGRGVDLALRALMAPLEPDELAAGLRTAVPMTTRTLTADVTDGGTARITVPPGFDRLSMGEQQVAMAQIVFTITADTLAGDVQLVNGSRVVAVPDSRGELVTHPVSRQDYSDLAPVG